jgi:glycosyltransferase involved in cell wall biosynthesis
VKKENRYSELAIPIDITEQNWPDDNLPVVSVFNWVYNHKEFIRESIESILMQKTTFPVEIIIHDDASSDGTKEIILEYQNKHPQLFRNILHEKNQWSQGKSVMTPLLEKPKGKYISLTHGDDYWTDPLKLQKQVDFLESNTEYIMLSHDIIAVNEKNVRLPEYELHDYHKNDISEEELVLANRYPHTNTVCFRNVISEFPYELDKVQNGDAFLFSLLGNYGKCKWMGGEIEHSAYRVHTGGVWSMKSAQEKEISNFSTYYWLYVYYKRIGSTYCAKWYLKLINSISNWETIDGKNIIDIIQTYPRIMEEIKELKNGRSYRLGRLLSSPLRKFHKLLNGFI